MQALTENYERALTMSRGAGASRPTDALTVDFILALDSRSAAAGLPRVNRTAGGRAHATYRRTILSYFATIKAIEQMRWN